MIALLVTYMQMHRPPPGAPLAPPLPGAVVARERMKAPDYLDLYRRVGAPVQWDSRLRMPPETLDLWLSDDANHIHVLRLDGSPLGLCEFEGIGGSDVELAHFGLDPSVQRSGLGRYLLDHALRDCWRFAPTRVWLHTDTNDHPRAQSVYARAGFVPYLQQVETFEE